MSLRFILGRSGSGKTEACLNEIIGAAEVKPLIYIVPEQFSLQSEKDLLAKRGKALMQIQVLSFQRLAFWVFSETGGVGDRLLDTGGKHMLLRKIVNDLKGKLVFFSRAVEKEGFIKHLAGIISEFYEYRVTVSQLEDYSRSVASEEGLSMKIQDIIEIYKLYQEYISDNYIVADKALDLLCDKIEYSHYPKGAELWIDGFIGFTPQEYNVLEQLLKKADRITVALTLDKSDQSPFFEVKTTISRLTELARSNGINVEAPLYLSEQPRFLNAPMLGYLEKNFFKAGIKGYPQEGEELTIASSANIYAEINTAAEKILELVREKGLRYGEIGVAAGSLPDYSRGIISIFSQYKLPFFIDLKTDILFHPLTECIRSALEAVVRNRSYESVFRFLKTGLLPITQEDVDLLENYVLAYGIKGSFWDKPFTLGFGDSEEALLEEKKMNELRETVQNCLRPFMRGVGGRKRLKVQEFAEKVFEFIYHNGVLEKLAEDEEGLSLSNQIWKKICEVFDKLAEILGQEEMSLKEFVKVAEAGLAGADIGLIPSEQDQVLIGDFERTRFPKIKALLILGVNEGVLPGRPEEEGLFSDEERERLTHAGFELAPGSRRRAFQEDFLIYCGITRPERFLFLSYSRGTLEGKALQPSTLISKVKKMFPAVSVLEKDKELKLDITLAEPVFRKTGVMMRELAEGGTMDESFQALYGWFKESEEYSHRLLKMETLLLGRDPKEKLAGSQIKKLYGKDILTGVSRLERYVQCPYAYFVQYNLAAKDRKVYTVQAVDLGNLFHNVLEAVTQKVADAGLSWHELTKELINGMVTQTVEELAPKLKESVFLSTERYKYLIKRVMRIAGRSIWALAEHIKKGDFEVMAAELEFKEGSPLTSISVNINDRHRFTLTGKIDRIDVMDSCGNKYIKIIDYKTGSKKFDIRDIYFGMQLQLILYADAFIKNAASIFGDCETGAVLPGGVFYFNIDDPIIDYSGEGDNDRLDEKILKAFKMTGLVLEDETVIRGLDKDIRGQSDIIPVYLKTDGSVGVNSSVAGITEYDQLRQAVLGKISQIGEEITEGNIPVFPYQKGSMTACVYCAYKGICQFEAVEEGRRFNVVR